MDTPSDSQRKAWARLSTFTSFVSRICFFKARRSDSDSVNRLIVIPPAFDFTRVRSGGVKKILSTYLVIHIFNVLGGNGIQRAWWSTRLDRTHQQFFLVVKC